MKKIILAGLVIAGGLLASGRVNAQTNTYGFLVDPDITTGAVNQWSTTVEKWDGTAVLPGKTFRIADVRASGTGFPTHIPNQNGVKIMVEFFGQLNGMGPHVSIAAVTGGAGVTTGNQFHYAVGGGWTPSFVNNAGTDKHADFDANNFGGPPFDGLLKKGGTNNFQQGLMLHGGGDDASRITTNGLVASIKFTIFGDSGGVWTTIQNTSTVNAPEAGSLALLLPGLLPLGLVLRKRSRSRASSAN